VDDIFRKRVVIHPLYQNKLFSENKKAVNYVIALPKLCVCEAFLIELRTQQLSCEPTEWCFLREILEECLVVMQGFYSTINKAHIPKPKSKKV